MTNAVGVKLVTIVAEAVLTARLAALVREVGASGYTLSDAEGEGCCLADCGIRPTPPQGRCAEWRHPPILTVV